MIEVSTKAPLGPDINAPALPRAAEYRDFLETTQLDTARPEARLECSRLGAYDELLGHILGHQYFRLENDREMPLPEAAASWFDNVYLPVAKEIREHNVLGHFPCRTEADIDVEITRRWLGLSKAGQPAGPDPAVRSLLGAEAARKWWRRRKSLRIREP